MANEHQEPSGTEIEQIKIVLNSMYLCLQFAMAHISAREGADSANQFKLNMLQALRSGAIDMALLEDTKTFDFVVEKIEALPVPVPEGGVDSSAS